MKPLQIEGWNVGFNKVEFTKMLREELGYSLSTAKGITDKVLVGERVELAVTDADRNRVAQLSTEIGAVVILQESMPGKLLV